MVGTGVPSDLKSLHTPEKGKGEVTKLANCCESLAKVACGSSPNLQGPSLLGGGLGFCKGCGPERSERL